MAWVLHDWNDDECIQILKKCKEAVPEDNGKVIIVEAVIGEAKDDKFEYVRLMLDIVIMAHTNTGKETTSKEWESVIQKAGFRSHTIKPIGAIYAVGFAANKDAIQKSNYMSSYNYLWILHDWNDDECIQILKKCKEAVPEDNGKVIIVEAVIGEVKDDKLEYVRLMLDMVMMAHTNTGKERTSKEWESVIQKAGFRSHTIKPIGAVQSIIEAFP
eukprot:XP_002534989.2 tabersonine 16-O-methyltransferase [Ricinus communis]